MHGSDYRIYSPRCQEDTRRTLKLKDDMVKWGTDLKRLERMRWYMGTAGIGKTALAQSVAQAYANTGRLGATFFFS
jgi:hypothetical protein